MENVGVVNIYRRVPRDVKTVIIDYLSSYIQDILDEYIKEITQGTYNEDEIYILSSQCVETLKTHQEIINNLVKRGTS